ncbi:hypothetical protein DNU06_00530 [Putridiphycobacter roseus]|uniref:Ig-like domain-containing protein n=1 Tax=Putridiphycobacter roseus TaxID=2219161 RepID=A0A2W1N3A8_9FLAO|nr:gliding motility-associated C-terminal domain-containing protein [Putridiphycobacter roseus]PZE18354.1 hypothetical protein DNU06_00530 [Putridiphycobacter roseus]
MLKGLVLLVCLAAYSLQAQNNVNCVDMNPICTNVGVSFIANGNAGTAAVGNNYGCLFTQPNPSWFYLEISNAGPINMSLSANTDIDYIIYGPFTNLANAVANCGTLGDPILSPIVDCSYSGVSNEFPTIATSAVGEVYILLVTNFSGQVQNISLTQISGSGATDCSIVPVCNTSTGTFSLLKNNQLTTAPIALCEGDNFAILSNDNYILPADTIPSPLGDDIYSAQLMFLVYDALPTGTNPTNDPGFTQLIIPADSIADGHNMQSLIVSQLGCGTYFFVPVTADDGIGMNGNVVGTNDNGIIHWDTDGNGCYNLGTAIEVKYTCPIEPTATVNCTGLNNGVDFNFLEDGTYYMVNTGSGSLINDTINTPSPAQVQNLFNGANYTLFITNQDGCTGSVNGIFSTPQFSDVTIIPGPDCPGNGNGAVYVEGTAGMLNGGLGTIIMNGISETNTLPYDTAYAGVGTIVNIQLLDVAGCHADSAVTINSVGHGVVIEVTNKTSALCHGDANGSATINAYTVDGNNNPDNVAIQSVVWTSPIGQIVTGSINTPLTGMMAGIWVVTVTDMNGCASSFAVTINQPDVLTLYVQSAGSPHCFGFVDGSINIGVTGGTMGSSTTFDWSGPTVINSNTATANNLSAGTYTVMVTDDNGCAATLIHNLPNPPAISANFIVKNVNCFGEETGLISVNNINNNQGPYTFDWESTVVSGLPSTSSINDLPAGTYNLIILDSAGCSSAFDFTILQNDSIETSIDKNAAYCRTAAYQSGNGSVFATANGGGSGSFSFDWSNDKNGDTFSGSQWNGLAPALYTVLITDGLGCEVSNSIVLDSIRPIASFTAASDDFITPTEYEGTDPVKVKFTNTSTGFAQEGNPLSDTIFQWNLYTNNPLDNKWFFTYAIGDKPDTTYKNEEIYQVCLVAKNYNDCVDTSCLDIVVHATPVLEVPNVFTPGAYPNNEFFFPNQGIETFECVVMNRYGVEVYRFLDIEDKWTGNLKNGDKPCSDGVYLYTYKAVSTNGTEFEGQGTISLIRSKK